MLHARLGAPGHVSADGNFSWLEVECLGACCNAPMVQINQDYYEDLTPDSLGTLMDDLAAGRPVRIGSQVGRTSSEPKDGAATLTDETLFDGSRVGAWRKRFEDQAADEAPAEAKAEAASTEQRAASAPKPARPDAGRATERPTVDAPAQRAAAGETPVKPQAQADAADGTESSARPSVAPTAGEVVASGEAAGAEAGTQSSLPRDEPPPQPAASGASEGEVAAEAEEARIESTLATLPKDASPEQKADAVGTRPAGLDAARDARSDALTRIKGIGPGNEARLHTLGIYHFDQIAAWNRDEIAWVGTYLAFPGRIDREGWVAQAAMLSASDK